MTKNIFLNKTTIVTWNPTRTSFMIKSPKNNNAGIWIYHNGYHQSKKYPNYYSLGINMEFEYIEWQYINFKKTMVGKIQGSELFELLQLQKNINSIKYLQEAQKVESLLKTKNVQKIDISVQKINNCVQEIAKNVHQPIMTEEEIKNLLIEFDAH